MSALDPVTLGVIWGALQSIAVEVGTTVHKTAYSEQAREGQEDRRHVVEGDRLVAPAQRRQVGARQCQRRVGA